MATYLDHILEAHRAAAERDGRDANVLTDRATSCPPTRGFRAALAAEPGLSVIAEIKRRSPSKGDLAPNLDPVALARAYEQGGASCLSVLTDADFFGGSVEDLQAARNATPLPVLRKDFTVNELDVCDTRIMGADCILLIAAALAPAELIRLHDLAVAVGLDVLVEVHDEDELTIAVDAGATLVGVNQRDLVTFEVDHGRAVRMAAAIPDGVVKVAESGVRDASDAASLAAAGYDAVLVGESLVTAATPAESIRLLKGDR